jgi:Ca2+/Na+ antiporter
MALETMLFCVVVIFFLFQNPKGRVATGDNALLCVRHVLSISEPRRERLVWRQYSYVWSSSAFYFRTRKREMALEAMLFCVVVIFFLFQNPKGRSAIGDNLVCVVVIFFLLQNPEERDGLGDDALLSGRHRLLSLSDPRRERWDWRQCSYVWSSSYFYCRTQKREMGLAMMLFCVVIVFFLCNILALVVNLLEV